MAGVQTCHRPSSRRRSSVPRGPEKRGRRTAYSCLRFEVGGIEHPGNIGIDHDDVRRRNPRASYRRGSPAVPRASTSPDQGLEIHLAIVESAGSAAGSMVSARSRRRPIPRTAAALPRRPADCGRSSRHRQPGGDGGDQRLAVFLGAQRRRQFQKRPVGPDIISFSVRWLIDHRGRDVEAGVAGALEDLERLDAAQRTPRGSARRSAPPAARRARDPTASAHWECRRGRDGRRIHPRS